MIKMFIAAMMVATVATAQAGNVSVGAEYEYYNAEVGSNVNSYAVIPAYKMGAFVFDTKLQHSTASGANDVNTVEARAKFNMPITSNLIASIRGSYGYSFVSSADDVDFYTVEPAVAYAITPQLSVNGSYRFRDSAFDSTVGRTDTAFVGVEYAIARVGTFGAKVFEEFNGTDGNGLQVTYNYGF